MNTFTKIAIVAVTSTALIGGIAFADKGKGQRGGQIVFEEIDTNSDGFITTAELEAKQAARFAERDANNDGFLTADELKAGFAARAEASDREFNEERATKRIERMVRAMDVDNDGKVSAEEANTRDVSKFFERLDTDGDGKISVAEMEAGKAKFKEKRENRKG